MNRGRLAMALVALALTALSALSAAPLPVVAEEATPGQPLKLKFTVYVPEYDPVRVRAAELLRDYAKQVGIEIEVVPLDLNVEIAKVQDEHDFWLYILGWSARNMPMYISSMFRSSEDRPGGNNAEGVRNATLDALADELDRTVDPERQREILFKIQELLADLVPWVGIYTRYLTQVWDRNWEGFHKEYWGYASPMTWRNVHKKGEVGGTFIVILASDLKTENPYLEKTIYEDMVWDAIYDTLVYLDDSYTPRPWLAYKYEYTDEGRVWTFYLVRNATFHDGEPITAEDVKFSFDYVRENGIPAYANIAKYVERVEVLDDYTVRVYLKEPYAWFLYDLADMPIVPKHVWEGKPWNATRAPIEVGSGPFKWSRRVTGEYVELVKYENYWRDDMPKVDRLIFRVITNFNTALLAMEAGEAHFYVYYIPTSAVDRVKQNPNLHLNLERGFTFYYLGFNLRRPPLDDVWLRRAIAYLLPKEEVVKGPLYGLGEPCTWYVSPYFAFFHNPSVPEKFPWIGSINANVEKAKEMLSRSDKYEYRDVDGDGILEAIPKRATPTTPTTAPVTAAPTTPTSPPAPPASPTAPTTPTTPAATETEAKAGPTPTALAVAAIVIVLVVVAFLLLRRR